jgi:uncharacterized membrane protein
MSPQFVDFDADGRIDIVAGTFDGSPKVARGTAKGFLQPVHVLDRDGARIVMNMFWNFASKQWDETKRCDPAGAALPHGHQTSAWACDWDHDGAIDLLLGDHDSGLVMVRRNEGTTAQPAFAAQNTVVLVGGEPLVVPGTVTTLRLLDVTGGREDLLVGSMGDAHGDGAGGGVFVYPDVGDGKVRRLGPAVVWVPPSTKRTAAPVRPDSGLYMDAFDCDGDGDLDLVVGGYSHWTPTPRELTDEQQAQVTRIQQQLADWAKSVEAIYAAIDREVEALPEAERDARAQELREARREELKTFGNLRAARQTELDALVPGPKRHSFVWLYENVTPK